MTWLEIWNNYINIAPGIGHIAVRLACAMLIGIVIGLEREYTHRPAGLRTHILVALGACVISITGDMLVTSYGAVSDPARLSAQVITGVGFLGAGTIMKEGASVKGLTTAASVWAVACLGLTAGFGYYTLALLGLVFIFITLTIVEALQHRFIHAGSEEKTYLLETTDLSASLNRLSDTAQANTATLADMAVKQTQDDHILTFHIIFSGRRRKKHAQRFFDTIATAAETKEFRSTDAKTGTAV